MKATSETAVLNLGYLDIKQFVVGLLWVREKIMAENDTYINSEKIYNTTGKQIKNVCKPLLQ